MSRRTKRRTDTPKSQAQVGGVKPKTAKTGAQKTELKNAAKPSPTPLAKAVAKPTTQVPPVQVAPVVVAPVVETPSEVVVTATPQVEAKAEVQTPTPTPVSVPVQVPEPASIQAEAPPIDLLPLVTPVPIQPATPVAAPVAAKAEVPAPVAAKLPPVRNAPVASSPKTAASAPVLPTPPVSAARPVSTRSKKALMWGFAGVLALVCSLGAAGGAYANWTNGEQIAPNVFIAGENISGLTSTGASWRLHHRFDGVPLQVTVGDQNYDLTPEDLGGTFSVEPTVAKAFRVGREGSFATNFLHVYGTKASSKRFMLPMQWDKESLVAKLRELDKKYRVEPVDARLKMGNNGLEVVPETNGREINIGASAHIIQAKYFAGVKNIELATRDVQPKVTAAALDGRDVELAHYTTRFNPGLVGRTINIHVASAAIEGHVLMPGERFSFNACTGERTWEKGYRMAHIFERMPGEEESQVVDGLAGGTCQVSSTLFNAVRAVNASAENGHLKIVERNTHSLPVTYVPHGLDATVAWPYKDFKFRNAFNYPVYLHTAIGASRLTISVWGRIPNNQAGVTPEPESSDDATVAPL